MLHIQSLREYIARLIELEEVQEIDKDVDWNLEAGAIIRRSYDLKAPAPLFNNIKDAAKGFRLFGAPAALSRQPGIEYSRVALSLGLPPTASLASCIDSLSKAPEMKSIKPEIMEVGNCKENIMLGDDIDLFKFPIPLLHEGDGGRYINTWGTVIVQTPDKRWTNWSIARIMVHDKQTMTGLISPLQHIGMILAEWRAINKPMPFALALGCQPIVPFVSGMSIDKDVDEADIIGGYLGEAVKVVPAESVDLLVPATAEIIIEGKVHADDTRPEGPMGEYSGYMPGPNSMQSPSYKVSAITHRNNPILPAVCAGEPVEEDHTCWALACAAQILADFRAANFPVVMCSSPPESALHFLAVSVDREAYFGTGMIKEIADIVFNSKAGMMIPKIIVVDKDVDVTDTNKVLWAFATRCRPEDGNHYFSDYPVVPLAAFLHPEERKAANCTKVIYDCRWPEQWPETYIPKRSSFDTLWPKNIQQRVLDSWNDYGY